MNTPADWVLVAHIIGIIYWLGGLIVAGQILVRLANEGKLDGRKSLEAFESKLLKRIVHPGAAVTVLTGIALVAIRPDYLRQIWLPVKLVLVVLVIAADLLLTVRFRAFHAGRAALEPRQARLYYGSTAVLLLFIVILAVVKPFS
jgi:protoporphyrinogen IX oxidase